jgi:hypothetical protein
MMWLWPLPKEPNTLTCETPRCLFNYHGREREVHAYFVRIARGVREGDPGAEEMLRGGLVSSGRDLATMLAFLARRPMTEADAIHEARDRWGPFGMARFEDGEFLVGVDEVMQAVRPGDPYPTMSDVPTWPLGRSGNSWEDAFADAAARAERAPGDRHQGTRR